jgi:cellulose synthase/poly-beta-1,6-N-acetylglucosamine synthase-like glycosyltransferase
VGDHSAAVLVLLRTLFVVALARRHVRLSARRLEGDEHLPPVSVLVPAYNEEVGIAQAVRSLVASDYPELEVLVIDDGSTDRTPRSSKASRCRVSGWCSRPTAARLRRCAPARDRRRTTCW